jgi:hypothetical protein
MQRASRVASASPMLCSETSLAGRPSVTFVSFRACAMIIRQPRHAEPAAGLNDVPHAI